MAVTHKKTKQVGLVDAFNITDLEKKKNHA